MDKASALVQLWHDLEAPDGLRIELLDGELVVQANPGHVHNLPGRCLVRHTPEPFEAWSARGLLVADDYRPRADAVIIRGEDRPADEADKGIFGQPLIFPEPMGLTVQTHGWHPYRPTPTCRSRD